MTETHRNGLSAVDSLSPEPSGGFSARHLHEKLHYDLRPFMEVDGYVPQPSHARRERFFSALAKFAAEAGEGGEGLSEAQIRENPEAITDAVKQNKVQEKKLVTLTADLCNGSPTKEQLNQLWQETPNVFSEFFVWICGAVAPNTQGVSGQS